MAVNSSSSSPTFNPLDLSEDFVPVREAKPAGETTLDFSGLLTPPLILHEDLKEGCGGQLWPAGVLLARFLLSRLDTLRDKTILELGAGGGLTGLALASALSRKGIALSAPLLITDLPVLLPLQEQNIALNGLSSAWIGSASLPWGAELSEGLPDAYKRPDVILAADCVYFEPAFPLLMETLKELMGYGKSGSEKETVCWFCMKKRRKADMRFIAALKKAFAVREVEVVREGDEEKNVHLYEVRVKGWKWL